VAAVANLPQRLEVPPSPSPPIRSFVIYYAFPRLVAALTARGVREQIGIFTSPCRLCSLRPPLSLSLSSPLAPPRSQPSCVCARSLRFRGLEPGRAFIPISFYYRLRNRALRDGRARVRNSRGRAGGAV